MIFLEQSVCPLCNNLIDDLLHIIVFPPLTSNMKDPLFILGESAVHKDCLDKYKLAEEALRFSHLYQINLPNNLLKCVVDGKEIYNPQDAIHFNLLTSERTEHLYPFNYTVINRNNVSKWKYKEYFVDEAKKFIEQGKWNPLGDFNFLEYLIQQLVKE